MPPGRPGGGAILTRGGWRLEACGSFDPGRRGRLPIGRRERSTPEAERRIAQLVAQGSTNREVAAALFLTEHSVETALTRVYQKLGVRSRADLAHLLAAKS